MQAISFMLQLENSNLITNQVVAINARDNEDISAAEGSDTVTKFGGWDANMIDGNLVVL